MFSKMREYLSASKQKRPPAEQVAFFVARATDQNQPGIQPSRNSKLWFDLASKLLLRLVSIWKP